MLFFQVFLASLGGSSVLLLAVAFLSKSIVKQLLKKNVEQFKNDIKKKHLKGRLFFLECTIRKLK